MKLEISAENYIFLHLYINDGYRLSLKQVLDENNEKKEVLILSYINVN